MQEIDWKFDVENIPLGVYFLALYKDGHYGRAKLLKPQFETLEAYAFIKVPAPRPKVEKEWRTDLPPAMTHVIGRYHYGEVIVRRDRHMWETLDFKPIHAPEAWCPL